MGKEYPKTKGVIEGSFGGEIQTDSERRMLVEEERGSSGLYTRRNMSRKSIRRALLTQDWGHPTYLS